MGFSDKYGAVFTERDSKSGPIGEDEPVAVFRAQDDLSVLVLQHYRHLCAQAGCSPDHLASVNRQIRNFESWRERHATRRPGDPA